MTTYTICVFTENTIGLLNKITIIFTRRRINIESLTVSETERKGISRFTIVIKHEKREEVEKLVRQIRKIIEVLAVFGYLNEDIVYNEIALYKISTPLNGKSVDVETINKVYKARFNYKKATIYPTFVQLWFFYKFFYDISNQLQLPKAGAWPDCSHSYKLSMRPVER